MKYSKFSQTALNNELIVACRLGHLDGVKLLLTSSELNIHAELNYMDALGNQAFYEACDYGHTKVVEFLLKQTNTPESIQEGFIAACVNNFLDIVKLLNTECKNEIESKIDDGFIIAYNVSSMSVVNYFLYDINYKIKDNLKFNLFESNIKLQDFNHIIEKRDLLVELQNNLKEKVPTALKQKI